MATHKETSFATESTVKTDSSLTAEQALDNEHGVKVDDKAVAADSVVAADSAVNDENRVAGDAEVVAADAAATTEAGVTGGEPTTAADATVATAAIKPVPTTDELLENGAPAHIAGPINMDAQIFMTNTKSSGFAILVLADNITTVSHLRRRSPLTADPLGEGDRPPQRRPHPHFPRRRGLLERVHACYCGYLRDHEREY